MTDLRLVPTPERVRWIVEHMESLGAYTQAKEVAALNTHCLNMEALVTRLSQSLSAETERCATIALAQRCERGTPWDHACTVIAAVIRGEEPK